MKYLEDFDLLRSARGDEGGEEEGEEEEPEFEEEAVEIERGERGREEGRP